MSRTEDRIREALGRGRARRRVPRCLRPSSAVRLRQAGLVATLGSVAAVALAVTVMGQVGRPHSHQAVTLRIPLCSWGPSLGCHSAVTFLCAPLGNRHVAAKL